MTNGEKIQKDFQGCEVCEPIVEDDIIHVIFADKKDSAIGFNWSWWNAEYKEPSSSKNPNKSEIPTGSTTDVPKNNVGNIEPTTKNDLAHNLCDSCTNIGCEFQSGIVRTKCVFYMPPQLEPDNCGNYVVQASATKNDLAVDCISRDEVCRYVAEFVNHEFSTKEEEELIDNIITGIERMPSVTPQIPTVRRERGRIKVNVSMDLTVSQAFHILLQTLNVELDDVPPKFEIVDGEIVCDQDNRGELYLALYHLATKIFPNTEFRHLFDDPNILMNDLYSAKEIEVEE